MRKSGRTLVVGELARVYGLSIRRRPPPPPASTFFEGCYLPADGEGNDGSRHQARLGTAANRAVWAARIRTALAT